MTESRVFKKKGRIIPLQRDYGEPTEHFVERGIFVISQEPSNEKELEEAVKMSRIFRNNKHDGAEYSRKLMNSMEVMVENMWEE